MSRVSIGSFEELTMELVQQLDAQGSMPLRKEGRMDMETTDSVITNIMPCSFPNPEQVLDAMQERLGRQWDTDMSIGEERDVFIDRMLEAAYN